MSTRNAARVGARIRRLRTSKGLSQRDVAEPEMTAAYLSLIESGQRVPSADVLGAIAKRLRVDVGELESGKPTGLEARLELALQEVRRKAHSGDLDAAETGLSEILTQAQRFELAELSPRAKVLLGEISEDRGDFSGALEIYDSAQNLLAQEPAHKRFEAVVGFARCTSYLGDTRLAAHLLETYLIELERQKMEDPTARMRVLSTLVYLYKTLGLERRSIEVAEEATRLASTVDDPEQVACMSMNVARSLLEQGRHDDAIGMLRRAEQVYQSLDWPLSVVRARTNRAIVDLDKGRLDRAYAAFSEIASTLESDGQPAELGAVLNYLGRVERLRGNDDEAAAHLNRARKLLPNDDIFEHAMNSRELGLALVGSDLAAAERELKKAANAYRSAGATPDAAQVLLELGRLKLKSGDAHAAARILEEGLELASSASSA